MILQGCLCGKVGRRRDFFEKARLERDGLFLYSLELNLGDHLSGNITNMAPLDIQLLTDDAKIAQICRDYWDCDENGKFPIPVAQVAKNHGLKTNEITGFVYENCNVFSEDYTCSKCGDMPGIDNRTSYSQMLRSGGRKIVCFSCQEEVNRLAQAERDLAKAKREADLNRRREAVELHYSLRSDQAPDVHSLTLEDVVYLLSFVRAAASEDLTVCSPLNSFARRLAPTDDYARAIVIHLYEKRLIQVHPQSPLDAFLFEEGNPTTSILLRSIGL